MNHPAAARTARWTLGPIAVGLVVTGAIIVFLTLQSASSSASSVARVRPPVRDPAPAHAAPSGAPALDGPRGGGAPPAGGRGTATGEDGALPDGVTVFDDEHAGVANLRPELLAALREAAMDAAEDGIDLHVNSGWRSPGYQAQLLREAVARYGSEEEAARWVASPDTSAHVSGEAVDIGPLEGTAWLSEHGSRYGLCQVYRNEAWHYELRHAAIDRGCPPMYADSAHDPNLQP